MESPEKLAEIRLAASRYQNIERLINLGEDKENQSQPVTYVGWDANLNQAIVSSNDNIYSKNVASNGLIVQETNLMNVGSSLTSMPRNRELTPSKKQFIDNKIEFIICIILSYPHLGSEDKNNDKFEFYVQAGKKNKFKKVHEILEVDFSESANGAFFYDAILYNYSAADIDLVLSNLKSPYQFELLYPSKIGEFTYIKNNLTRQIEKPAALHNGDVANYFLGNVASPRLNSANWGNLYDGVLGNYYIKETIKDSIPLGYNQITYILPNGTILNDTQITDYTAIETTYYSWTLITGNVYPYPQYSGSEVSVYSYQGSHELMLLPDLMVENSINVTISIDGEKRSYNDGFGFIVVPTIWV